MVRCHPGRIVSPAPSAQTGKRGDMDAGVRGDPTAIDAEWLTEALEAAGVAKGATVQEVDYLGLIGTGQAARTARFQLRWDDPAGRPSTVIGKFPSADPTARANNFATGSYVKEWVFYDQIVDTVDIRSPRCHVARFDEETPDFVLVMEDIQDATTGEQIAGLTADQVELALQEAVKLHAPRWGDAALESILLKGQPVSSVEESAAMMQMFYEGSVAGFTERLGSRLDDDVVELVGQLAPKAGRWAHGSGTPKTLVHYDLRADNLLFGQSPDTPPIAVVDFQSVNFGLAGSDVAYLIAGSFPDPAERATVERDLVEGYRKQLAARGVELSADEFWRDYRFGSVWGVLMSVMASMVAEQTERGDEMLSAMAQRHGRQVLDLDALSVLD